MRRIFVVAMLFLLVGCTDEEQHTNTIKWAVIQPIVNEEMKETEEIMVFDADELEDIQNYVSQTNWQPNTKPEMARHEDVVLRLFIEVEQNMPERIKEYRIWFEQDNSMTILSNVDTEGYGRLNAKFGKPFNELLQLKMNQPNRVIDVNGQLENKELFEQFLRDIEEFKETTLKMTRYTIEGAPIFWTVTFNGEYFDIEVDNREDAWGSKNIEKYQCEKLKQDVTGSLLDYNFTACEGGYEINLMSIVIE